MKITGQKFNFNFGGNFVYQLYFIDKKHLDVTVVKDFHPERVGEKVDAMRSTV
jgi:hypothetical protein